MHGSYVFWYFRFILKCCLVINIVNRLSVFTYAIYSSLLASMEGHCSTGVAEWPTPYLTAGAGRAGGGFLPGL